MSVDLSAMLKTTSASKKTAEVQNGASSSEATPRVAEGDASETVDAPATVCFR